jgi:hypothetical protein
MTLDQNTQHCAKLKISEHDIRKNTQHWAKLKMSEHDIRPKHATLDKIKNT